MRPRLAASLAATIAGGLAATLVTAFPAATPAPASAPAAVSASARAPLATTTDGCLRSRPEPGDERHLRGMNTRTPGAIVFDNTVVHLPVVGR